MEEKIRCLESVSWLAFLVVLVSGRAQTNAGKTGWKLRGVCQEVCCSRESWARDVKPAGSGIQITPGAYPIESGSWFF